MSGNVGNLAIMSGSLVNVVSISWNVLAAVYIFIKSVNNCIPNHISESHSKKSAMRNNTETI